jgi:hypothetical protein
VTTARIPVRPPRVYESQVAFASEKKTPPKRGLDRGVLGIFGTVRGDGGYHAVPLALGPIYTRAPVIAM